MKVWVVFHDIERCGVPFTACMGVYLNEHDADNHCQRAHYNTYCYSVDYDVKGSTE
jgi:hypothetical protein